jgi:predicted nucleic acid-binding Zn ribbon protein
VEIKIKCPECGKEIKVLLHMVDKLKAENQELRRQLQKQKETSNIPDFLKEIFK